MPVLNRAALEDNKQIKPGQHQESERKDFLFILIFVPSYCKISVQYNVKRVFLAQEMYLNVAWGILLGLFWMVISWSQGWTWAVNVYWHAFISCSALSGSSHYRQLFACTSGKYEACIQSKPPVTCSIVGGTVQPNMFYYVVIDVDIFVFN